MSKLERYFNPDILPLHKPHEIEELMKSVELHGQLRPIITYQGKILDGFKVYEKLIAKGLLPAEIKFQEFSNTTITAFEYRVSTAYGRALTQAQKACLATDLRDHLRAERNEWIKGKRTKDNMNPGYFNKNFKEVGKNEGTREIAAKQLGISPRIIGYAETVKKKDPYLFGQVRDGKMSMRSAFMKVKPDDSYELGRNNSKSKERTANIEIRARKVLQSVEFTDYKPPGSIYEADLEFWKLDQYMRSLGFNLSLNRVGGMFDAVFTRSSEKLSSGHPTYKAAMLAASKEALSKLFKGAMLEANKKDLEESAATK
jgi:hypothetical protein